VRAVHGIKIALIVNTLLILLTSYTYRL